MDVCAGSGIGSWLARQFGWRTVCYIERDPAATEVLVARMRDGSLDEAPIWDDLTPQAAAVAFSRIQEAFGVNCGE
jgi:site-specific DNA-cytosine methylase